MNLLIETLILKRPDEIVTYKDFKLTVLELAIILLNQTNDDRLKDYVSKYLVFHEENSDFRRGVIDAFSEVVHAGVKRIALSHATDNIEQFRADIIAAHIACQKYHISMYVEDSLIQTLLFKNSGAHVVILYDDPNDLDEYLALKEIEQSNLNIKKLIAKQYGLLLSYSPKKIEKMIQSNI